jgi:Holliday junction resolvase RusA-like endonuclease
MSLIFRMKRPLSHFVARNRGMGQLKPTAPTEMSAIRSDIDNLAKFILDCLNGVIYKDDHQIFHLVSTKLLDSEADCLGSTEVLVREVAVDELERILRK